MTGTFAITPPSSLSAVRAERDRFVALAFCWADILIELDGDEAVVYAAGAIEPFLGHSVGDLLGQSIEKFVPSTERAQLKHILGLARRRERFDNVSLRLLGARGLTPPMGVVGYQLQELNGHFFLALRHTAVGQKATGFGRRRTRDEETGLLDSESFIDMVTSEIAGGTPQEARCMSLIVLPGYEDFRSRLVDAVEVELLAQIGEVLQQNSVDGDGAARLGSGRYGLVHQPGLDLSGVQNRISQLTRESDPLAEGIQAESATIAIDTNDATGQETGQDMASGVAYTLNRFRNDKSGETVLRDLASSIATLAHAAVAEVNKFKELVSRQDFEIAFQPILNARTGAVHYYEALARIPASYGGADIYEHIAFAEEAGLITAFDIAMLDKLLRWIEKNTSVNGKTCFGINVSGRSIGSLSYMAQFERLLRETPWLRGRLIVELTESARIVDIDGANEFVQRIRGQGFRVALDDFGTGAANFEYLAKLNVDLIKFDGAALHAAFSARQGKAFLKALVAFCRELGVATAAEMIENESLLDFARSCGVQFVQGFFFGRPRGDVNGTLEGLPHHAFPERIRFNAAASGA